MSRLLLPLLLLTVTLYACLDDVVGALPDAGGNRGGGQGTGGDTASGGGSTATGGNTATGGGISAGGGMGTGGSTQTGGGASTGGNSGTGGGTATGGNSGTGGGVSTGGGTATGGSAATGGGANTGGGLPMGGGTGTGGQAMPTCSDDIKNGNETDKDCGANCPKCANGKMCGGASDCTSNICDQNVCEAPCVPPTAQVSGNWGAAIDPSGLPVSGVSANGNSLLFFASLTDSQDGNYLQSTGSNTVAGLSFSGTVGAATSLPGQQVWGASASGNTITFYGGHDDGQGTLVIDNLGSISVTGATVSGGFGLGIGAPLHPLNGAQANGTTLVFWGLSNDAQGGYNQDNLGSITFAPYCVQ